MDTAKWQEVKAKIKENFKIIDERTENNDERREDFEIIEFMGPAGKMMVEFITRPVVLDKKTLYSNRIGSQASVEYVYDENEFTRTLKVYRWDDGLNDWQEIKSEGMMNF